jgi:hypothetical protein
MITLKDARLFPGRAVVYKDLIRGKQDGRISSANDTYVFVRFKALGTAEAVNPEHLEWSYREPSDDERLDAYLTVIAHAAVIDWVTTLPIDEVYKKRDQWQLSREAWAEVMDRCGSMMDDLRGMDSDFLDAIAALKSRFP